MKNTILILLTCLFSSICVQAQDKEALKAAIEQSGYVYDLSTPEKTLETKNSFVNTAFDGETDLLKNYLKLGIDINTQDEFKQTALYAACSERRTKLALFLLDNGADANIANEKGRTPLLATVRWGFSAFNDEYKENADKLIKSLLEKGADVNAQDNEGRTPLIEAGFSGDYQTIKELLVRGADSTKKTNEGRTVIDEAAKELRGLAVKTLVESGVPLTTKQKIYYTCYRIACTLGWALPVVIIISFLVGYFGKRFTKPVVKRNAVEKGDNLPHLAPLKCDTCGAGVPLKAENMKCPRCDTSIPVPEDYAKTIKLREKAAEQLQKAVRAWRRANIFLAFPIRWFLFLIAPPLLVVVIIGCFTNIGNSLFAIKTSSSFLAMFALLGGVSFAIALWAYSFYLTAQYYDLPIIPDIGEKVGEAEIANCHLCGGGIAYAAGDLVASCGYCGGETYRVKVTNRALLSAAEEEEKVTVSLYDAMAALVERRQFGFKAMMYTSGSIFGLVFLILIYAFT